jgi:hypothetical protein
MLKYNITFIKGFEFDQTLKVKFNSVAQGKYLALAHSILNNILM